MSEERHPDNPDRDPLDSRHEGNRPDRTFSRRLDDTSHFSKRPAIGPGQAPPTELPQLGAFQLISQVGEGGVGTVYRAFDTNLGRVVALKVLRSGALASETEVKRFNNEAHLAAALDHPSIVPVFENGENNGVHYLAMAFIDGIGLNDLINQGPIAGREAAKLIHVLASAMDYAHEKGVIHRDLKPSNVLLVRSLQKPDPSLFQPQSEQNEAESNDGRVTTYFPKIVDFGIARQNDSASGLTTTGSILGTPSYMSPEQASFEEDVTQASDVYSLGTILYAMICGRPPFQAATPMETVQQVITQPPVPPRRLNATIDRNLEIICLKCLWKQPARRYQTAGELVEDLERYLQGRPVKARPVSLVERFKMWCRRNPALAIATVASLAMIATVFVLSIVFMELQLAREQTAAQQFKAEAFKEAADLRESLLDQERSRTANQKYYVKVLAIRERAGSSEIGWTRKSIADINLANEYPSDVKDILKLRSEALRCLTSPDLLESWSAALSFLHRSHLAAYSPDGKHVAFATLKNRVALKVRVLDAQTGKTTHQLQVASSINWQIRSGGDVDGIRDLSFTDSGKRLVVRTRSDWLHVWDLKKPDSPSWSTRFPLKSIEAVAFDPLKPRAFLIQGGNLHEWPDFHKNSTRDFASCNSNDIAISADGQILVARDSDSIRVFDLPETKERHSSIPSRGGRLFLSHDGELLASTFDRNASIFSTASGNRICRLHQGGDRNLHQARITSLAFSKCKSVVLTGSNDRSVKLWDTVNGQFYERHFIGGTDSICVKFSPTANQVVVTGHSRLSAFDVNGLAFQSSSAIQSNPIAKVTPLADGDLLTAAMIGKSNAYSIAEWDSKGVLRRQLTSEIGYTQKLDMAVTADLVAITSREASAVHFLSMDGKDLKLTSKQELRKPTQPTFLHGDTNAFYCIVDNARVGLWSIDPWSSKGEWSEEIGQIQGGPALKCLALHRNWVMAAKQFGRLEILNNSLRSQGTIVGKIEPCSVALTENLALCGLVDGTIRLISLPSAKSLQDLQGHAGEVNCARFLPFGAQLLAITASGEGQLRLWRVNREAPDKAELQPFAEWRSVAPCEQIEFHAGTLILRMQEEKAVRLIRLHELISRLADLGLE